MRVAVLDVASERLSGLLALRRQLGWVQYVDALRAGDLELFQSIEEACSDWWHVGLDRGAGAALHFAADHGQVPPLRVSQACEPDYCTFEDSQCW